MFKTGQAEPLVLTRIPRPRSSRGERAEQPRKISNLRPQSWSVRAFDSAENKALPQIVRVREQSATTSANSSRTRIVHDPRQAKNSSGQRIRISFMGTTIFPVHIQVIQTYAFI